MTRSFLQQIHRMHLFGEDGPLHPEWWLISFKVCFCKFMSGESKSDE
jgi:hypothetical protein